MSIRLSKKNQVLLLNTPDEDIEDVFPKYDKEELLEYKRRLEDLDEHIKNIQKENYHKHLEKRLKKMEDLLVQKQHMLEIALDITSQPKERYKVKKTRKKKRQAAIFIMWSDWHYEELVLPERVNGLNKTTPKIMDKRINKCYHNSMRLAKMALNDVDIVKVVIHIGGDMISGNLHTADNDNFAMLPGNAIKTVYERIAAGIEMFANEFGNKLLVVASYGNHARITQKITSSENHNSLEWMYNHELKKYYPDIKIIVSDGAYEYVDFFGKTVRFTHGHHVANYRSGVGGLYVPIKRNLPRIDKGIPADLTIMGHYHQYIRDINWLCNSSLIGFNTWAMQKGFPFTIPCQRFFLYLSNGIVAGEYPILVE